MIKLHVTSLDVLRKGTALAAVRAYMPTNDLAKIQGAGFGVLRPIWDLDKAMNADGSINHTYLDGVLDACSRWLGVSALNEIVLCAFNGPNTLNFSAWQEVITGNYNRASAFFTNLAIYIAKNPALLPAGRIWFEFMNEPRTHGAVWDNALQHFTLAVRNKLPSCGILMGFGGASGLSDLMNYVPVPGLVPDKKRRWSLHQYAPWWIIRGLGNAPGVVYGLDYDWPMSVDQLEQRFIKLGQDPTLVSRKLALSTEQKLVADIQAGTAPLPIGQTFDSLLADCDAKVHEILTYADNMVRYDAWGMGTDPQTGQGREWTMTGNHDAVPFNDDGLYRTLKVARDWELATGETLMMTEGGGGGGAYGSQTSGARTTILRLQAAEARVYKKLGWAQWGWWLGNSLFLDDTVPGQRQIDAELLAAIVDGVAT